MRPLPSEGLSPVKDRQKSLNPLRKREAFRKAFSLFEVAKVARYGEKDIGRLMANSDP